MTNHFRSYNVIYIAYDRKNENHWPMIFVLTIINNVNNIVRTKMIGHYLLLIIRYSLLITHYSLLITRNTNIPTEIVGYASLGSTSTYVNFIYLRVFKYFQNSDRSKNVREICSLTERGFPAPSTQGKFLPVIATAISYVCHNTFKHAEFKSEKFPQHRLQFLHKLL